MEPEPPQAAASEGGANGGAVDVVTVQFTDLITQLFAESRVGVGVATELWPFAPQGTRREHSEHRDCWDNRDRRDSRDEESRD
jgi:hypothetical protein